MLIAILVLQAFMIVLFLVSSVLSIVGWQKLTRNLTGKLETLTEKGTGTLETSAGKLEMLTEKSEKSTERLEQSTETLTETLAENRLSVSYEHVIDDKGSFFKNEVVAKCRMRLLYDGIPIWEPMEREVYRSKKVDKEAVQAAFTGALQGLEIAIAASGIPLTVLNKIEDVTKALSK